MIKRLLEMLVVLFVCVLAWPGGAVPAHAGQDNALIVVASDAAFAQAGKWVSFLQGKTITVQRVSPGDFEKFKNSPHICVLGSPSESGPAGTLVTSLLSKAEQDWVIQQGNRKLYVKENVFAKDQTIFVFAAYSMEAVQTAIQESREEWWETIMSWYGIEMEPAQIRGY